LPGPTDSLREAHSDREHALLLQVLRGGEAAGVFAIEHPDRVATGIAACLRALEATAAVRMRKAAGVRAGLEELVSVLLRGLSSGPGQGTA
jgi:hypothetical protein